MAILLKCGAVFIHIPKTGGSWIRKVLFDQDLVEFEFSHEHSDFERTTNVSGHYLGNYLRKSYRLRNDLDRVSRESFKFCFVRNPIGWYESFWRFMSLRKWQVFTKSRNPSRFGLKCDLWHPWSGIEELSEDSFQGFMARAIREYPGYLTQMYQSYIPYRGIDFVGKQESLLEDFLSVLNRLDVVIDEDRIRRTYRINTSFEHKNLTTPWSDELLEEIFKLEYPTFQRYGYSIR